MYAPDSLCSSSAFFYTFVKSQAKLSSGIGRAWDSGERVPSAFRRNSSAQESRLATLDRQLLEQQVAMKQCFDLGLSHLLAIFGWGTPLVQSTQLLRLEVEPT